METGDKMKVLGSRDIMVSLLTSLQYTFSFVEQSQGAHSLLGDRKKKVRQFGQSHVAGV